MSWSGRLGLGLLVVGRGLNDPVVRSAPFAEHRQTGLRRSGTVGMLMARSPGGGCSRSFVAKVQSAATVGAACGWRAVGRGWIQRRRLLPACWTLMLLSADSSSE